MTEPTGPYRYNVTAAWNGKPAELSFSLAGPVTAIGGLSCAATPETIEFFRSKHCSTLTVEELEAMGYELPAGDCE